MTEERNDPSTGTRHGAKGSGRSERKEPLRGRVAQVLNEREFVINIGSKHGIEVGMYFAVLSEDSLPILDPNTGEELGRIERDKVRVKAVEVQERLSICRTYKTYTTGLYLSAGSLASLLGPMETRVETLSTTKEARPKPLSPEESYVQIGVRSSKSRRTRNRRSSRKCTGWTTLVPTGI